MKKFLAFVFALFFAAVAVHAGVIPQQVLEDLYHGDLEQELRPGQTEIYPVRIVYGNEDSDNDGIRESSSGGFSELGLTISWNGRICDISGEIKSGLGAGEYKAYIEVVNKYGDTARTDLVFKVLQKPSYLHWAGGDKNPRVDTNQTIEPIDFICENAKEWSVTGLPSGITAELDTINELITISGTISADEYSDNYVYRVYILGYDGETFSDTGTITVNGIPQRTRIELVDKGTRKVTAGDTIEPIVFKFSGLMRIDTLHLTLETNSLRGRFTRSISGNQLIVRGTIDDGMHDGYYSLMAIAKGEGNYDTARVTFDVSHKLIETTVTVLESDSQTVTAGDSVWLTNFPGGYELRRNGDTVTIVGLLEKSAKGRYAVTLSTHGLDRNASASATIDVIPLELKFDLVEGSDSQTVVAGQEIVPIVYEYDNLIYIEGNGFPAVLEMENDAENKRVTISGTVDPESDTYGYVYTFKLVDYRADTTFVTGKINVISKNPKSSSATASSSSTEAVSSSSAEVAGSSSSSAASSSSSAEEPKSSSDGDVAIAAVSMPGFGLSYSNNELSVVLPQSSTVRLQVFDLMGHLVESFAEPVSASRSFSLAHLKKGNYVVRVESSRFARTAKVVVK